jgi:hypothetical protein
MEVCAMDVSDVVNWGTILTWLAAIVLYIGQLIRGETKLPKWLSHFLSSNLIMGFVVGLGFVGSVGSMYINYGRDHEKLLTDVIISAYPEGPAQQSLQVVSGQTFENENIPLDGHVYDHCTFVNVCLLYDGGPYQLQHATFKDHWKICVKELALKNYLSLALALHLTKPNVKQTQKTVIKQP